LIFFIESTLILLVFKNTKKLRKIKFYKKRKKVEGPILRSMQHFTYKYWFTTQTKGGGEILKKRETKQTLNLNPSLPKAAAVPRGPWLLLSQNQRAKDPPPFEISPSPLDFFISSSPSRRSLPWKRKPPLHPLVFPLLLQPLHFLPCCSLPKANSDLPQPATADLPFPIEKLSPKRSIPSPAETREAKAILSFLSAIPAPSRPQITISLGLQPLPTDPATTSLP
jgi:hypothetical protein